MFTLPTEPSAVPLALEPAEQVRAEQGSGEHRPAVGPEPLIGRPTTVVGPARGPGGTAVVRGDGRGKSARTTL
ncbi:hypothetical protein GCM10027073_39960 [Streptomyces chlorus]|uniref:Uncharacterized protein n=1 Tax=Streptomyces chlorus TaxID=887452 RepID=A0ABW1DV73_9ACTN